MNTLSWLIYAAEVSHKIGAASLTVAVLGGILIIAASFMLALAADVGSAPEGSWRKPFSYWWVIAIAIVVATVTPSSRTIYMIAASEVGETVVTSPDAVQMMGDLKAIIKKRLKSELDETDE